MAATDPPVYPGSTLYVSEATKRPMAMTKCGHTTTLYRTFDVKKFERKIGRRLVPPHVAGSFLHGTLARRLRRRHVHHARHGARRDDLAVYGPECFRRYARGDRISISFMKYDPPLGQPFVDIMVKTSRNDKAAAAQFKRMCPNGF